MKLGEKMKGLREHREYSLRVAGKVCGGLSHTSIRAVENGDMNLTFETICKMAMGYGVSLGEIFAGVENHLVDDSLQIKMDFPDDAVQEALPFENSVETVTESESAGIDVDSSR